MGPINESNRPQILMGDLIGWDRVAELTAQRKSARQTQSDIRRVAAMGGSILDVMNLNHDVREVPVETD